MEQEDLLELVREQSTHLSKKLRELLEQERAEAFSYRNEVMRLENLYRKHTQALQQIQALGDQVTVAEAKRIAGEALQ